MLLLSVVVIWGLLRLGNIEISYDTLARLNWRWLGLAFVIFYSGVLVRGLRWQQILKTMGWSLSYVYTQTLLIAGLFISQVLPARLGDVGRVVMLKQDHHIPLAQGVASLAAERALDVAAILALAFVGAVTALPGHVPPEVIQLMVGAAVLFALGLLGLLVTPELENWLRRPSRLKTIFPAKLWSLYQKGLDFGFNLLNAVRTLGRNPLALIIAALESLYIWLSDALVIYLGLLSLNAAAPLSVSLLAGMVSDLSVAVPITPAGLGQFEVVLVWLLTLLGVATTSASLAVLLARLVSFWSFLPIGGVVMYSFGFARVLSLKRDEGVSPATPQPAE
jgi:glycosyltransferase AglD